MTPSETPLLGLLLRGPSVVPSTVDRVTPQGSGQAQTVPCAPAIINVLGNAGSQDTAPSPVIPCAAGPRVGVWPARPTNLGDGVWPARPMNLGVGVWPARPMTPDGRASVQSPEPPAVPADTRPGCQADVGLQLPLVRREGRGWTTSLGKQVLTGSSIRQSN